MDRLRLAGLPDQRDRNSASDGRGADLCPALCLVHACWHCRRRRSRCAGSRRADAADEVIGPGIAPGRSTAPNGRLNADQRRVDHRTPVERPQKTSPVRDAVVLDTQLSARLRDQMIAELNELGTGDEAARWAKRRYPDKTKRLNEADAEHIDQCFRTKLLSFAAHDAEGAGADIGGTRLKRRPNQTDGAPRSQSSRNQSTRAPCRSRSRAGCGIASTSGMWLINPAWSVAASPAMPTTCALRKAVHLDARSAMSSPSRCAAGIIASSTATAMKPNGGAKPLSIHSPLPGACGLRPIRSWWANKHCGQPTVCERSRALWLSRAPPQAKRQASSRCCLADINSRSFERPPFGGLFVCAEHHILNPVKSPPR